MATIDSISTLSLWLDSTDITTFQKTDLPSTVLQWTDKSSNAYQFIPLRNQDRPCLSTNAVLFDQVSSFQFISRQKIPAVSSLDFYAMVTPYSLWGPFQPFFESADITLSETDGRFNTQIYADGSEYFKSVPMPSTSQGAAIYKGDLYIGQNSGGLTNNFLQKWNPISQNFDFVGPEYFTPLTQSLSVFQGKLYASCYNGGAGSGVGPPASTIQMVIYDKDTNTMSNISTIHQYGVRGPYVYNRNLYTFPRYGWMNSNTFNTPNPANPSSNPYLYRYNTTSGAFENILNLQYQRVQNATNAEWGNFFSNAIAYKGTFYIAAEGTNVASSFIRYQDAVPASANLINQGVTQGYLGIYYGTMIVPRNDQRLFKYNPPTTYQNFGRLNFSRPNSVVAYKGNLWVMKNGLTSNTFEIFSGEGGGPFSNSVCSNITTNTVTLNTSNLLIVHEGKLFLKQDSAFYTYVYGNGASLDQSFSTLVGAPVLVNIRRNETSCQMYLNGLLVESKATNFTFSNQSARQMFVGGAAGTISAGASDCGSDHFQGAIHSIAEYSSILSIADRQRVEGILCWQFGTQNTLPVEHPYRNSPP
jgi:hypothetical protein